MDTTTIGIIALSSLLVLIMLGMPVSFSLGIAGFFGLLFLLPFGAALHSVFSFPWTFGSSYGMVVVVMFVLTGNLAFVSGISRNAFEAGQKLVGRLPGGLGLATIFASACFAATTGSSIATVATVGRLAMPEMEKRGYNKRLAAGCVAAAGTLGILIPPSVPLVIYGIVGEQSVGKLLIAGIIPGVLSAIVLGLCVVIRVRINPSLAPKDMPVPWKETLKSIPKLWEVGVLFVVMIGGIYAGVFTPTEAGAIGAIVTCLFVLIRGKTKALQMFRGAFGDTAKTAGMVLAVLTGAAILAGFLTLTRVPYEFAQYIANLHVSRVVVLLLIILLFIPLGMFLDPLPIILITVPILLPTMIKIGYDPIWFGIIMVKMMEIAMLTPPVGLNVYVTKDIAPHIPTEDIFIGIGWFVVADVFTVTLLVVFPQIVLWLPNVMYH